MFGRLFLLFTLVPALELYLLIKIGTIIGSGWTIAVILITGAVGAWLARAEGAKVWFEVQQKLSRGAMPGDELIEALLLLIAGALLITPGFLTDIAGFALLAPPTRKQAVIGLKQRFAHRVSVGFPQSPDQGPWGND